MTITSTKWETLAEISQRTKRKYDDVKQAVREEFQSCIAVCRFTNEGGYGEMLEFKSK